MKKSAKGTDHILKRLNFGRRTFLKGLIASGVGGLSGALFRSGPGMALGCTTIQRNGLMGQAIGTAAALSIKRGVSPRDLNVDLLQQELVKARAFLG